jgi:hypothetical protein
MIRNRISYVAMSSNVHIFVYPGTVSQNAAAARIANRPAKVPTAPMRSDDAALVVVLLAVAAGLVLVTVVRLPEVETPPLLLAAGTEVEILPPGKVLGAETPEIVLVAELRMQSNINFTGYGYWK